jgi:hypothetical protein
MKWCLGGLRVRQISLVEGQHANKTAELTGGVGRMEVLKMGYPFFQRSENLGKHLVTEEGDLGCSVDALCRVDEDPVPLKSVEESP